MIIRHSDVVSCTSARTMLFTFVALGDAIKAVCLTDLKCLLSYSVLKTLQIVNGKFILLDVLVYVVWVIRRLILEKIYGLFPIGTNGTICIIWVSVVSGCPLTTEWGCTVVFH